MKLLCVLAGIGISFATAAHDDDAGSDAQHIISSASSNIAFDMMEVARLSQSAPSMMIVRQSKDFADARLIGDNDQKTNTFLKDISDVLQYTENPITAHGGGGATVKYLSNVGIAVVKFGLLAREKSVVDAIEALRSVKGVGLIESDKLVTIDTNLRGVGGPSVDAHPGDGGVIGSAGDGGVIGSAGDVETSANKPDDRFLNSMWSLNAMNTFSAWDIFNGSDGPSIKVCVIDTGISHTHRDLASNVYVNEDEFRGLNGEDDDGNGYVDDIYGWNTIDNSLTADDDHGHGTHCAGIIGAVTNNRLGIAGLHWKPSLIGCKFLDKYGQGLSSGTVECLDYSIAADCRITSNSYGGYSSNDSVRQAIMRAGDVGMLFVGAAGNNGVDIGMYPHYPGWFNTDSQINVAATTNPGNALWGYSNYSANRVQLAAPGASILSTYLQDRYAYMSGTSMAAPQVAGIAAALMSYLPELTAQQVKDILKSTAVPFDDSDKVSWGRVDFHAAMVAASEYDVDKSSSSSTEPASCCACD